MPSTVLLHNHNGECLKEWSSDLGPIQIGRAPKNDSQAKRIDSGSFRSNKTAVMSSKHAVIEWRGPDKQPWIADVGSTNGTVLEYPDGLILHLVPYEFVKLLDECIIQFGKSVTAADGTSARPLKLVADVLTAGATSTVKKRRGYGLSAEDLLLGDTDHSSLDEEDESDSLLFTDKEEEATQSSKIKVELQLNEGASEYESHVKATSDTGEYDSQDSGSFPSPALHLPQKHTFSSNLFVQGQTNAGIRSFFASSRSSGDLNEEKQSNLPDRVMPAQEHGDKSSPLAHQDQSLLSKENDNLHTDETLATDKADTSLPEDIVSEVFQVMSDITGVPLGEVKETDARLRKRLSAQFMNKQDETTEGGTHENQLSPAGFPRDSPVWSPPTRSPSLVPARSPSPSSSQDSRMSPVYSPRSSQSALSPRLSPVYSPRSPAAVSDDDQLSPNSNARFVLTEDPFPGNTTYADSPVSVNAQQSRENLSRSGSPEQQDCHVVQAPASNFDLVISAAHSEVDAAGDNGHESIIGDRNKSETGSEPERHELDAFGNDFDDNPLELDEFDEFGGERDLAMAWYEDHEDIDNVQDYDHEVDQLFSASDQDDEDATDSDRSEDDDDQEHDEIASHDETGAHADQVQEARLGELMQSNDDMLQELKDRLCRFSENCEVFRQQAGFELHQIDRVANVVVNAKQAGIAGSTQADHDQNRQNSQQEDSKRDESRQASSPGVAADELEVASPEPPPLEVGLNSLIESQDPKHVGQELLQGETPSTADAAQSPRSFSLKRKIDEVEESTGEEGDIIEQPAAKRQQTQPIVSNRRSRLGFVTGMLSGAILGSIATVWSLSTLDAILEDAPL